MQIWSFYDFKNSKNSCGGAVSQRVILHDERGLIANQGGSHDEFVIFGVPG